MTGHPPFRTAAKRATARTSGTDGRSLSATLHEEEILWGFPAPKMDGFGFWYREIPKNPNLKWMLTGGLAMANPAV